MAFPLMTEEKVDPCGESVAAIRFGTPFISYETDIFCIFGHWNSSVFLALRQMMRILRDDGSEAAFFDIRDPFAGLSRHRIQHVAVLGVTNQIVLALFYIRQLAALQTLSILGQGPDIANGQLHVPLPCTNTADCLKSGHWPTVVVQEADCESFHLSTNPTIAYFQHSRLCYHLLPTLSDTQTMLSDAIYIKGLLWHTRRNNWGPQDLLILSDFIRDYVDYFFGDYTSQRTCPLELTQCDSEGKCKEKLSGWRPGFNMSFKFLYPGLWAELLMDCSILHEC